jgi:hypothetical protein
MDFLKKAVSSIPNANNQLK